MKTEKKIDEIRNELEKKFPGTVFRRPVVKKKKFVLSAASRKKLKRVEPPDRREFTEITFRGKFSGSDGISLRRVFRYLLDSSGKAVKSGVSR